MTNDYLVKSKRLYKAQVLPHLGQPCGCAESEIDALQAELGFPLPVAYRQYLQWMGADHDGIFIGCDWFLKDVRENTAYLPGLLAENEVDWQLPSNYLVFMGHQGYIAAYFELPPSSDDPEVFLFSEGREPNTVTNEGPFSEFLFRDLAGMAAHINRG